MRKVPPISERATRNYYSLLANTLARINMASSMLINYIESLEKVVSEYRKGYVDSELANIFFAGTYVDSELNIPAGSASAFNSLVAGVGIDEPSTNKLLLARKGTIMELLKDLKISEGTSLLPRLIKGIEDSSHSILEILDAEPPALSASLSPSSIHVAVKVLESLLNSLRSLFPLYNRVTRYLMGLYSMPRFLVDEYYVRRGERVEIGLGGYWVEVEMENIVEYDKKPELGLVGAVSGSLPHQLARLVFLGYELFSTRGLEIFFEGLSDELRTYIGELRPILKAYYSSGLENSFQALVRALSPLCIICPCDGEPFISSLRDERYGAMYSKARCGYLAMDDDNATVNGVPIGYERLTLLVSPLLATGLAQVRRSGGRVVLGLIDWTSY